MAREHGAIVVGGGVCMAERTVRAQARLAAEAGATMLEHTAVERIVAPLIGRILADLATSRRTPMPIGRFPAARFSS